MHSQQSTKDYTHWAARGDAASAAIPLSISATAARSGAQGSKLQHTEQARIGESSCIDELALHRVSVGLRRRISGKLADRNAEN